MKAIVRTLLLSCALAAPALSFAQSEQAPLTRAEVRADLIRLEQAGYQPGRGDDATYPRDIQAAEAKVAAASMPTQPQAQASLQPRIDAVRNAFYYGA